MKNILLKYNFVKILPFEDTFYYAEILPKNIIFSKELLRLNYLKNSPFLQANIIGLTQKNNLMVWFYEKNFESLSIVPESYLLYLELKKQKMDAIYIIEDTLYKVLVIKNDILLNSFILKELDLKLLHLTKEEYQLNKQIEIKKDDYEVLYKKAIKNLTLKDIYKFNQFVFDKKTFFQNIVNKIAYPLCLLLFLSVALNYGHGYFLDNKIQKQKSLYLEGKEKNKKIKIGIKIHNKEVIRWKNFIKNELIYPDYMSILMVLNSIFVSDEKVFFSDLSINGSKMLLRLKTDINPVIFLNRLSSIKYFDRVVILSTHKQKNRLKIITYDIDIKPLEKK